jgi:hypothetical protein
VRLRLGGSGSSFVGSEELLRLADFKGNFFWVFKGLDARVIAFLSSALCIKVGWKGVKGVPLRRCEITGAGGRGFWGGECTPWLQGDVAGLMLTPWLGFRELGWRKFLFL